MQYKWTAVMVTTMAMLMAGINIRLLIIGLPTVARQLHAGAEELIWISQSFQLAATVSLLIVGRVSDIFGRVKLFTFGFVVFTIGSVLAIFSFSTYALMGFLVMQGLGAALLLTNSSAIVTDVSPKNELGVLLSVNQTAFRVGAMLGLTLSGIIISYFNWRGLFLVNIPVGVLGAYLGNRYLREISAKDVEKRIDWSGFVFFTSGLVLLLLAITYLSYGASVWIPGGLFLGGTVLIFLFIIAERRTVFPLVDLSLFRIKVFSMGNLANILYSLSFAGLLVLVGFYLQIGLGYSPFKAGIAVIPIEVTFLLTSVIGGKLSDRYGSRTLSTLGLAITSLGMMALSTLGDNAQYVQIATDLAVIGLGSGLFITPNSRAIMGSVPPNRRGVASAIYSTAFNTGFTASYGLAIFFLTLGIPSSALSTLLQAGASQLGISALRTEFFNGFRIGIFLLALFDIAGIIPSIFRGAKETRVV